MFSKSIHILAWIGTLFLSMSELCPMVWICYILFTYSPNVGGHLGCFHVLSIWNTSLWTFMHIFVLTYVYISCVYIPKSGMGRSYVTLYITFWGIAKLFSKQWQRFPFPSSTFENSDCSTSSPLPVTYCLSVRFSHLSGCDVVSHWDFDLRNQF